MRRTDCDCWSPCHHEPFRVLAWAGGSSPRPIGTIGRWERDIVTALFREQWNTFTAFWGSAPDHDTARIFWNRARHDAHATGRVYGAK